MDECIAKSTSEISHATVFLMAIKPVGHQPALKTHWVDMEMHWSAMVLG